MLKTSREKVVQNAEKYVSRGKIESGIKEYRKLLDENPNDISTLNRVGDLYARISRNSEAIDLFHQIAEQYATDGFLVKAIAIYKKIIKLDPTLLEIYEQLADLYHRQGLVNEARTQYQVLADYYIKHDKPASAIHVYERMVELEPDNPTHHVKLAELYQKEEMFDQAMGEYRAIAELMLEHGRGEEAAQVYERGLTVTAEDIGFITDGVLKLKEAGHIAAAAHFLSLAVERNPQAERVARIAGLGEGAAAGAEEAPVAGDAEEAEEAPSQAADDAPPPAGVAQTETAPSEEPPGGDLTASTEPGVLEISEPDESMGEVVAEAVSWDAATGSEAQDLSDFELELDDDEPTSLVQPPPDMLEDRERPGAAWAGEDEPAAAELAPAEPAAAEPAEAGGPDEADTAAGATSGTGTFEFELDLDVDGEELLELSEEADAEPVAVEPEVESASEEALAESAEPAHSSDLAESIEPDTSIEIDHDLLERTAAEVHEGPASGPDDLFTEAEVLARYGIQEKALERLAELLQREPRHLAAYALMVGIHLDAGRHGRAAAVAGSMLEVAVELGDQDHWPEIAGRLEAAGHRIEGLRVTPPEGSEEEDESTRPSEVDAEAAAEEVHGAEAEVALETAEEEGVEIELDDDRFELPDLPEPGEEIAAESEAPASHEAHEMDTAPPPESKKARRRRSSKVDAALEELAGLAGRLSKRRRAHEPTAPTPSSEPVEPAAPPPAASETPAAAEAPPVSEPPAPAAAPPPSATSPPAAGVDPLRALGESLREEIDLGADEEAPAVGEEAVAASAAGAESLDDTGMSWLDEVPEPAQEADLFAGEDDFFDLGAELEQELTAEESLEPQDDLLLTNSEQSLEDIVEGFKRGVAENLSTEDYDTHFNLGIAYREMGLLDEAIGEFQLASKHTDYLVSCASMLGLCFLEKGLPELAVKWYSRGLEAQEISEEDQLGLLYDLGNAQAAAGDSETAYHTFVDLYGINTNYRDVVARLAELEPR